MQNIISANWPAPKHIHTLTTTRLDGVSHPPFDNFNLANHTGDNAEDVVKNRERLRTQLHLPSEPIWLKQTHSTLVLEAVKENTEREGDASYSRQANQVCVAMTADCLPLLVCNRQGTEVAAIHAGWRGLADGIIESTFKCLQSPRKELLVWLGPAMGPKAFEVKKDVYDIFVDQDSHAREGFTEIQQDKWLMDIYHLAKQRLNALQIDDSVIYGGKHCTYHEEHQFFSYRRENKTGRMASLIWINTT